MAAVNASGRYFEFYAARNYYDRPTELAASALSEEGGAEAEYPAYVVPNIELRRALALARKHDEGAFYVAYTRLPHALLTPGEWKAYGGSQIVCKRSIDETAFACSKAAFALDFLGLAACDEAELALLAPPPWWITKLLHPYPAPLLAGAGDGIHCST